MIVDFSAFVGDWPTYGLPIRDAEGLVTLMDDCGVAAAFVSLAGGALRTDPGSANADLARMVGSLRHQLLPLGIVDIETPGWQDDLSADMMRLDLAGVRLYPNYSDQATDPEQLAILGKLLSEWNLPLFVAAFIDEERFQHPKMRVPPVTVDRMRAIVNACPGTTLVLNNLRVEEARDLYSADDVNVANVFMDIAAMDSPFDGLISLLDSPVTHRLVFGSQMPFLQPQSVLALLQQPNFPPDQRRAILELNWGTSPTLHSTVNHQTEKLALKEQNQ